MLARVMKQKGGKDETRFEDMKDEGWEE